MDAVTRGIEYLQMVRRLALSPSMVDVIDNSFAGHRGKNQQIYTWIGDNIHAVNTTLTAYIDFCRDTIWNQAIVFRKVGLRKIELLNQKRICSSLHSNCCGG